MVFNIFEGLVKRCVVEDISLYMDCIFSICRHKYEYERHLLTGMDLPKDIKVTHHAFMRGGCKVNMLTAH